ncbi:MAG TPA: DEAD/DEAH box helicase [Thermoanaerobaculia bacterium]
MRTAVRRLASTLVGQRPDASPFRAAVDILVRCAPRVLGLAVGADLQRDAFDIREAKEILRHLDDSYLFIQGPPGSGKTYNGARLIVDLLRNGRRVGVSATAHKAIHNLLHEVEKVASAEHYRFSGLKRFSEAENQFNSLLGEHALIANANKIDEFTDAAHNLIAGTKWLFADPSIKVDYLFVDEAGQVALADALAMATASRNVVLLGDPLQLAQVSQGVHPTASSLSAGASVLEHLLGDAKTIPRDRGLFLEKTWRMHPDVSGFISSVVYDGRLESAPGREVQHVESAGLRGSGLRFLPVEHESNSTSSEEEAETVAREVHLLLQGGSFTNIAGKSDSMTPNDILVVAPYNAQVRCVQDTFTREGISGVRVGTVDKFQGLEAPVVFFTMATSSGDDLPRDIDFLFSQNRLNVAVSRAQCLAVVIASPRLLDVSCRTPDQMRLVNALCRFIEMAHVDYGVGSTTDVR